MTREEAIQKLREHEAELRSTGVVSLSLFGSVARGESPANDVDVAVRVGPGFSRGGFDYFGRLQLLSERLATILQSPVDVVEEPTPKLRFQQEINKDRALAF